ncbi:MAG TPA: hypothetical protein PKV41_05100, partial [Candidatus Omnitrophota bacterium]|nr:hypothetical protein [Candidatus Omnitrophota bacterium]
PLIWAFAASFLYWTYLFFTSTTPILFDCLDYQSLGRMIQEQGWTPYFETGPNREPIYPFIISLSMSLAKLFSVPYLSIQKFIQLLFLFLTQILVLKILKSLKIRDIFCAICILYLGFSPSLVNSALSLYSEVVAYPVILAVILFSCAALNNPLSSRKKLIVWGLLHGLALIISTFIKGIFEIIAPLYLMVCAFITINPSMKKTPPLVINLLIFFMISFLTFSIPLTLYKSLNKKYNGSFSLTNRGAWALYGNTARRMDPLAMKNLSAAFLYAPGEGICKKFLDAETCRYWSFEQSDKLGYEKLAELRNQGISNEDVDKRLIWGAFEQTMRNPFQYALFAGMEGLKMIFWESTQIGFVDYPDWLTTVFSFTPFKNSLRLIISLLTLSALFYCARFLWAHRKSAFPTENAPEQSVRILFCSLALIVIYISLHSFFFILTRYALPIAPLYLILITFSSDRIFLHKK